MTRDELLELLLVERHLPLPPAPKPGVPYDDPRDQYTRRASLLADVDAFEKDSARRRPDEGVQFERRGAILVGLPRKGAA